MAGLTPTSPGPARHPGASGPRPGTPATKRALDLAIGLPALVLLSPVMAGIWVAIRLTMGSPALFRQVRPGLRGRPFEMVKFRTMTSATTPDGELLPDDDRITPLGRRLRRLSLDELPELINVVRGEMSLVGPRPLLVGYLRMYTPDQARRHEVKPGITGWAQVHGRRHIQMADRFALDVWYVDHWSLALDLRILALTVARVVRGSGVEPRSDEEPDPFQSQPVREDLQLEGDDP